MKHLSQEPCRGIGSALDVGPDSDMKAPLGVADTGLAAQRHMPRDPVSGIARGVDSQGKPRLACLGFPGHSVEQSALESLCSGFPSKRRALLRNAQNGSGAH